MANVGYSLQKNLFLEVIEEKDVNVILCVEGKDVSLRMGSPELPQADMVTLWQELIAEWNTGGAFSREEKDLLCMNSQAFIRKVEILGKLLIVGFKPPILSGTRHTKAH
jgi:hypothetical protein